MCLQKHRAQGWTARNTRIGNSGFRQTTSEEAPVSGAPIVGKIVAVRALDFNRIHQVSNTNTQLIPQQSLENAQILQISISCGIWFGTRGSEVQILSPRPISKMVSMFRVPTLRKNAKDGAPEARCAGGKGWATRQPLALRQWLQQCPWLARWQHLLLVILCLGKQFSIRRRTRLSRVC